MKIVLREVDHATGKTSEPPLVTLLTDKEKITKIIGDGFHADLIRDAVAEGQSMQRIMSSYVSSTSVAVEVTDE